MDQYLKGMLLGAGLLTAGLALVVKLFAFFVLYTSVTSATKSALDALSLVGEVKIALILLAIALVLDSCAIILVILHQLS